MNRVVDKVELDRRKGAGIVALGGAAIAFFIGLYEGYTGIYLYGLEPILVMIGLIMLVGGWIYFYYKGKHSVVEKQSLVYLVMLGIVAIYAMTAGIFFGILIIAPYAIGLWEATRK